MTITEPKREEPIRRKKKKQKKSKRKKCKKRKGKGGEEKKKKTKGERRRLVTLECSPFRVFSLCNNNPPLRNKRWGVMT
jgi:hypothetical protein